MINKCCYPVANFPFREAIYLLLGTTKLDTLHELGGMPDGIVKPGSDNHTVWHNRFYDNVKGSEFAELYDSFLRNWVRPMIGEPIVAQRQPTFRIHWRGNLSVGAFHRDSDYHHNPEELNFWLPVTQAYGTNTIWIESAPDRGDFKPFPVEHGEVLTFPGGKLVHGNKINETIHTRVSFDFRVIPQSLYVEPPEPKAGLGHGKMRFKLGEYYTLVP